MASNQTTNYGLNQWEATDQVLRTDFNQDNQKIDAALKGLADKDTALEGTLASQAAAIAAKGNCEIQYLTYVGNGSSSRSFTFSGKPLFICIMGGGTDYFLLAVQGAPYSACFGSGGDEGSPLTWNNNQLTLTNYNDRYRYICNESGKNYFMVACIDVNN